MVKFLMDPEQYRTWCRTSALRSGSPSGRCLSEVALWLINQGRKYVEAPRWAALGIVVIMVVFAYNVIGTAIAARRTTGIITVLMIDLIPLILLYLIAFPAIRNMSADLFWWWWLVHLWVDRKSVV